MCVCLLFLVPLGRALTNNKNLPQNRQNEPPNHQKTVPPIQIHPKWSQEAFQSTFSPKMPGAKQTLLILGPLGGPSWAQKWTQSRAKGDPKRRKRASKSRKIVFRSALLKKSVFNTIFSNVFVILRRFCYQKLITKCKANPSRIEVKIRPHKALPQSLEVQKTL